MNLKTNNTILKKIAFIVLLLSCSLSWAQQFVLVDKNGEKVNTATEPIVIPEPKITSEEDYNKVLNYIPRSFAANTKPKPDNKFLQGDLNSISSLELRYAYQQQLKLDPSEIKWMEGEIDSLATAFFTDGKPTIIKHTGSYEAGCHDKGIDTENRNGYQVTIFKFCYTCQGALDIEDRFVAIFNARTEKLIAEKRKKHHKKKIK